MPTTDTIWPDIANAKEQTITLDSVKLTAQLAEIKIEIIRRALTHLGAGEQDVTERHYTGILRLSDDGRLQLPNRVTVHRQVGKIIFEKFLKTKPAQSIAAEPVMLKVPGVTQFGSYTIDTDIIEIKQKDLAGFKKTKTNLVEWYDFEKLKLPLEIRPRKRGDKFWPLGLAGEKRVGKFLTAAKVSSIIEKAITCYH